LGRHWQDGIPFSVAPGVSLAQQLLESGEEAVATAAAALASLQAIQQQLPAAVPLQCPEPVEPLPAAEVQAPPAVEVEALPAAEVPALTALEVLIGSSRSGDDSKPT